MNMDKRYCQNRQRKRKRTIVPSPIERKNVSPSEEERQFKLRRFVEDVGKFLSEKESCPDQKIIPETKTSLKEKRTVKKVTIPKPMMNRGLFQRSGMQTKFCTRGGVLTREMTTRLDENLHQIISLGNNNQCNHQCRCTHHCKGKYEQQTGLGSLDHEAEPRSTSILRPLQPRSSPSREDLHPSVSPPAGLVRGEGMATSSGSMKNGKTLSELDKELYPLFARVVSVSCTQTKSALFKNRSYVSAVKRKLLQIYVNGMNKQPLSYLQESKKATSSIGTSPYPSPVQTQSSHHNIESPFKLAPAKLRFQSTMQFLEETIGPSSSCSSKQMVPSSQHCQSHFQLSQPSVQCSQPHLQYRQPITSLLSPPVVGYQRPQRVSSYMPKASRYIHEPYLPSSPAITPLYNLKSKVFDGRGDGFHLNCFNSFLPPIEEEEDSPDFRYYPRKIF